MRVCALWQVSYDIALTSHLVRKTSSGTVFPTYYISFVGQKVL